MNNTYLTAEHLYALYWCFLHLQKNLNGYLIKTNLTQILNYYINSTILSLIAPLKSFTNTRVCISRFNFKIYDNYQNLQIILPWVSLL